jgi:ligand-binding sensor domain-containing protein
MTNKIHIVHLLVVFSFLLISNISYPQYEAVQFEHITIKEGLSNNSVVRILKDSRGFMWFCTPNGLNRYDGKSFKVYKHSADDLNSLSNNNVVTISLQA